MSPRGEVGEGEIRAKSAYNKTLVRQMSARSHLSLHEDVRGRSFHGILSLRTALQVSPGLLLRLCSNRNRPIDSIDDVHCGESWMRTSARPDLYSRGRDSRDEYSDEGRPPVTLSSVDSSRGRNRRWRIRRWTICSLPRITSHHFISSSTYDLP
jgi:hypothetical protein